MAKIRRTFYFNSETDADLLATMDSLPDGEKSKVVRQALRMLFSRGAYEPEPTLGTVLSSLAELREMVEALRRDGVSLSEPSGDDSAGDEIDSGTLNNLRNLGL